MIAGVKLSPVAAVQQQAKPAAPQGGGAVLQQVVKYLERWGAGERALERQLQKVPPEARALIDAQLLVHKLHFEAEVMTRAVDTLSSTVRRLQQVGSS